MKMLQYTLTTLAVVILFCSFLVFILEIPMPWKANAEESYVPAVQRGDIPPIQLVSDPPHTLEVPEEVRRSLGMRKGNKENLAAAKAPTEARPLVIPGSTALDPARIVRVRARFAPAEVVKIDERPDNPSPSVEASRFRELRPGDEVKEGEPLGVFHSVEVGSKKNDLFEAVLQFRLDKIVLDRAEKAAPSLPDVFLWNARRNVQTDRSGIIRAKNTLKTWNIANEDIDAVVKEAEAYDLTQRTSEGNQKEGEWGEKQEQWARVVMKAPCSGVIVERNISRGEMVVDNTVNLFTIAQVDRLAVLANIPEDDLPVLQALTLEQKKWTIQTVGVNPVQGLPGTIDEIGYLIDPNQHTAMIKGYIDNPGKKLRAGQFVSATVNLPPPRNVVEIPIDALVDDGKQSLVFVQTDPKNFRYTIRRVVVTQRLDKTAFIRSNHIPVDEQLSGEEKDQGLLPRQPLLPGEVVLTGGVLELKATLLDKEASAPPGAQAARN
jgi:membrane fusion protein, heavy metal efflux system